MKRTPILSALALFLAGSVTSRADLLYTFNSDVEGCQNVIWQAAANTGAAVEGVVPLDPPHLARLQAGEPLTLTAVRAAGPEASEALYAIELSALNQAPAVQALVGYMAGQLASDLLRLVPPGRGAGPAPSEPQGRGAPPPAASAPPGR